MDKKFVKILTTADKVLILILVLIIFSSSFLILSHHNKNGVLICKSGDNVVGKYDLRKDRIININDDIIVEIKDNKARIKYSTCPLQYCVKQGWIKYNGDMVVCVPNKCAIYIVNDKQELDLITK